MGINIYWLMIYKLSLKQKVELKLFGFYEYEPNRYRLLCFIHGLTEGYRHGWANNITCIRCMEDLRILIKEGIVGV